jgi:epoxyqueuosine reductase
MSNNIFGCDICQIVCPWNRFAKTTTEEDFSSQVSRENLKLSFLNSLSKNKYENYFEGTPVMRAGYIRFKRNIKIAKKNETSR